MKNRIIEIKWALIFIVIQLLWMWVERLTGLHDEHIKKYPLYSNFIALPAMAVYILAMLDKRKNAYNGNMSFNQAFITGMIIVWIVTLLSPLTQWISTTLIAPDYFPNMIEHAVNSEEMTRQAAENRYNLKRGIIQGAGGTLVPGVVASAMGALFTRTGNDQ